MTKKNTLKEICEDLLKESLAKCKEIDSEESVKQKQDKEYEFKNDIFNKEVTILKNDYSEFFSREKVENTLEKIDGFDDTVDIITTYKTIKEFYSKREIEVKKIIHSFIQNYVNAVNDFEFIRDEFNRVYESFFKFLESDILEVYYFTPIFNLAFPTKNKHKEFDKIKLTKIDNEKFKIIKEDLVGKIIAPPGYLHKLAYVLETRVPFEDNRIKEDTIARERFEKFLNVAHLFSAGDLKIGGFYKNYTPWTTPVISERHGMEQSSSKTLKLKVKSIKKLKDFHKAYCELKFGKNWKFIKVAIDRFTSSILRTDPIDKIVDLNVALECLFSSAGETSLKVSNRTSMLAGIDDKQEHYWNVIKDEYKLRNDILHGRKPKDQISGDDVEELEEIIRKCIKKFLNFSDNLSVKDLKGQGKLSNGKVVRDYILEELDIGLINRVKLAEFLKQSVGRFD